MLLHGTASDMILILTLLYWVVLIPANKWRAFDWSSIPAQPCSVNYVRIAYWPTWIFTNFLNITRWVSDLYTELCSFFHPRWTYCQCCLHQDSGVSEQENTFDHFGCVGPDVCTSNSIGHSTTPRWAPTLRPNQSSKSPSTHLGRRRLGPQWEHRK